jgi:hypothetical protein
MPNEEKKKNDITTTSKKEDSKFDTAYNLHVNYEYYI